MNLTITLEGRFVRTPDKKIWTHVGFTHSFWQRYLEIFDNVNVVARIHDVSSVPSDWKRADGVHVSFTSIPYYVGPWQYLLNLPKIQNTIKNTVGINDAIIMRTPSQVAISIEKLIKSNYRPYGVEVVGDPYDVFGVGSIKHFARSFFQWHFVKTQKRQCVNAVAVSYVTEKKLQEKYPTNPKRFSTYYSDVYLLENDFAPSPCYIRGEQNAITIITVGTLEQLYKAPDVLIKAMHKCISRGLNVRLIWVGDGKYRKTIEYLVAELNLDGRVQFTGKLPAGKAVQHQLDQANIFVLPSRTEGLPRAMIEAMARGLPCIGSTVGGIPELLPTEDMVPPGDVDALAKKIEEVVSNPARMIKMSKRNLERVREYHEDILRDRRIEFYEYLRNKTEEWLKIRKPT